MNENIVYLVNKYDIGSYVHTRELHESQAMVSKFNLQNNLLYKFENGFWICHNKTYNIREQKSISATTAKMAQGILYIGFVFVLLCTLWMQASFDLYHENTFANV